MSLYEFQSYAEANQTVTDYILYYNETRIHSSLKYMSPHEFIKNSQGRRSPIKKRLDFVISLVIKASCPNLRGQPDVSIKLV